MLTSGMGVNKEICRIIFEGSQFFDKLEIHLKTKIRLLIILIYSLNN